MSSKLKRNFQLATILFLFLALPFSLILVGGKTNFFNKAYLSVVGKDANLVVNFTSTKPFVPNWTFYAQGGESSEGMLTPVVESMKKLNPKYVRLDHIYDFYEPVSRNADGKLVYNWIRLDNELEAISLMGAKPFISLSYMPPTISSGSEVDLPISWDDWSNVVKATIEHVSGRGGLGIADVYYEVWNEPDLFGAFKLRGAKNYLNLYSAASSGAKSAGNTLPFKFGGPATTALYKSWTIDFIKYVQENNLLFDFYSWHRYSVYVADFDSDISNLELWKKEFPELAIKEFVISESGHTPTIDEGYDNKYSSIQTMALITSMQQKVNKVFTFEIVDGAGESKYWGRWGLLTNPKWGKTEEKPRFAAMQFLNQMLETGISLDISGQGDFVRAMGVIGSKSIKLFVVNYDPSGEHFEKVPLSLNGLIEGEYTYRYSEFLGNSYELPILINGAVWKTDLLLKPNTAVLIELIKNPEI